MALVFPGLLVQDDKDLEQKVIFIDRACLCYRIQKSLSSKKVRKPSRSQRSDLIHLIRIQKSNFKMEDYKFLFKVVLVGNAGVGKTCLVRRFTQGMFPPGQGATIGVDFMIKTVEIDGEKIKVRTKFYMSIQSIFIAIFDFVSFKSGTLPARSDSGA